MRTIYILQRLNDRGMQTDRSEHDTLEEAQIEAMDQILLATPAAVTSEKLDGISVARLRVNPEAGAVFGLHIFPENAD